MNIYRLYFFVLILFIVGCSQSFKVISEEIDKSHREGHNSLSSLTFHDIRMKLFRAGKLDFLKHVDTVFMLEAFNVEEAAYYGKIWTVKDNIEYTFRNNEFSYNLQNPFTKYMSQLISTWDTTAIRDNEKLYSNIIPAQRIYGTKIIYSQSRPRFYIIQFNRFFNADRDKVATLKQ